MGVGRGHRDETVESGQWIEWVQRKESEALEMGMMLSICVQF